MTMIEETLRRVIEEMALTPEEINNGNCDLFADRVAQLLPVEVYESDLDAGEPGHLFIRWRGRFYDAECLTGVRDYHQLPIFKQATT